MQQYIRPEIQISEFDQTDIITTSDALPFDNTHYAGDEETPIFMIGE